MLLDFFTNGVFTTRKPVRRIGKKVDIIENQVKDLLQKADQKLILMVRQ